MFKKQMEINYIYNVELIEAALSNANDKAFFEVAVSSFGGNLVLTVFMFLLSERLEIMQTILQ